VFSKEPATVPSAHVGGGGRQRFFAEVERAGKARFMSDDHFNRDGTLIQGRAAPRQSFLPKGTARTMTGVAHRARLPRPEAAPTTRTNRPTTGCEAVTKKELWPNKEFAFLAYLRPTRGGEPQRTDRWPANCGDLRPTAKAGERKRRLVDAQGNKQ